MGRLSTRALRNVSENWVICPTWCVIYPNGHSPRGGKALPSCNAASYRDEACFQKVRDAANRAADPEFCFLKTERRILLHYLQDCDLTISFQYPLVFPPGSVHHEIFFRIAGGSLTTMWEGSKPRRESSRSIFSGFRPCPQQPQCVIDRNPGFQVAGRLPRSLLSAAP